MYVQIVTCWWVTIETHGCSDRWTHPVVRPLWWRCLGCWVDSSSLVWTIHVPVNISGNNLLEDNNILFLYFPIHNCRSLYSIKKDCKERQLWMGDWLFCLFYKLLYTYRNYYKTLISTHCHSPQTR